MIEPTAVLTIGGLTFEGDDEIVEMNEPALVARTDYATSSHLDGSVALRSTWENANINALIRLQGDTQAALEALKDSLRAELAKFSTTVTQTINGQSRTYTSEGRGSMTQGSSGYTYENLRRFVEVYQVSIPVYPVGA